MSIPPQPTVEQLLQIIDHLQASVTSLTEQVAFLLEENERLRKGPASGGGVRPLPSFVKPNRPPKERRKRDHSYSRPRQEPTQVSEHVVEQCPDCGRKLCGGWLHGVREVPVRAVWLEIPCLSLDVIHHLLIARACGVCRKRHVPKPDLSSVALGSHRFGVRLMSLVAHLVNVCRMPVRTVQSLLRALYGLKVSAGQIVGIPVRAGRGTYAALREAVRASPFVHADETGWRENAGASPAWISATLCGTRAGGILFRSRRWAPPIEEFWPATSIAVITIIQVCINGAGCICYAI